MRLFSVDELDKDTRALLYDVLHPHQRKAVIRELLRAYDSKLVLVPLDTKTQLPFVFTHNNEWLDATCAKLMSRHVEELARFPLQVRQLTEDRFLKLLHKKVGASAREGWRWNAKKFKYQRHNNSVGKDVKAEDKLAEEQNKRKRKLEELDEKMNSQAKSDKKHKKHKERKDDKCHQ